MLSRSNPTTASTAASEALLVLTIACRAVHAQDQLLLLSREAVEHLLSRRAER
jgi:hypothetical protein